MNMTQTNETKKRSIFGLDSDVLGAMVSNIVSWILCLLGPRFSKLFLPPNPSEDTSSNTNEEKESNSDGNNTQCISISRPGGIEQLRLIRLKSDVCTVGYNMKRFCLPPFTPPLDSALPQNSIILRNEYFSVNYADVCIRWGLYESANQFVGYPIVPGFDVAGTIEQVSPDVQNFKVGQKVFGCTLFGGYSSRVLIPQNQLRTIPKSLTTAQASALPAVSLTALYALSLAGHWPQTNDTPYQNKAILIHSAAGGVGGMLVQMSKLLGLSPVVGVVGSPNKIQFAKSLGCDVVIDKRNQTIWHEAKQVSPSGYKTIMDANGVSTLQQSYNHLSQTGRLIVYGFHSNLPLGQSSLSPFQWIKMGWNMFHMPKLDPMELTTTNKSVMGFNLSFFAEETELVGKLMDQIVYWLESGMLIVPTVKEVNMENIADAHEWIQSGKSVGKIVVKV